MAQSDLCIKFKNREVLNFWGFLVGLFLLDRGKNGAHPGSVDVFLSIAHYSQWFYF